MLGRLSLAEQLDGFRTVLGRNEILTEVIAGDGEA